MKLYEGTTYEVQEERTIRGVKWEGNNAEAIIEWARACSVIENIRIPNEPFGTSQTLEIDLVDRRRLEVELGQWAVHITRGIWLDTNVFVVSDMEMQTKLMSIKETND